MTFYLDLDPAGLIAINDIAVDFVVDAVLHTLNQMAPQPYTGAGAVEYFVVANDIGFAARDDPAGVGILLTSAEIIFDDIVFGAFFPIRRLQ